MNIRRLATANDAQLEQLADVLIDCVEGGSSIGFMLPLSRERIVAFWRRVAASTAAGERILFVAEDAHGICGTVQVVFAQPENQPHRADIAKMLVHRRARRQGFAAALMRAAEVAALEAGKTLLVLDTASDDAARVYERLGWVKLGVVPRFALLPAGGFCATTFYYRDLAVT